MLTLHQWTNGMDVAEQVYAVHIYHPIFFSTGRMDWIHHTPVYILNTLIFTIRSQWRRSLEFLEGSFNLIFLKSDGAAPLPMHSYLF